jgi:hypothetical protein
MIINGRDQLFIPYMKVSSHRDFTCPAALKITTEISRRRRTSEDHTRVQKGRRLPEL